MSSKCTCTEWKENIDKLNSGFIFDEIHGGKGYTGVIMRYCPWCGEKLILDHPVCDSGCPFCKMEKP